MKTLLAPNGKPSKLTPEQYKLVRSEEFKKWFGDWDNDPENSSKVIDEETKEPLVCYHNSSSTHNIFKTKGVSGGNGIFLSLKKNGKYGKITYILFVKSNLFDYKNELHLDKLLSTLKQHKNLLKEKEKKALENGTYTKFLNDKKNLFLVISGYEKNPEQIIEIIKKSKNNWNTLELPFVSKCIKKAGFDGSLLREDNDINIMVFNSNQIKLADGTNTTFDANNDDIRFNIGGGVSDASFKNIKKDKVNYLDILKDIWSNFNIKF
jgi:hypothetical protein